MQACVDIGGTQVRVSLNDGPDMQWLARCSEPTVREGDAHALAQQVLRLVDEACAQAGVDGASVQRAGVSACGPFVRHAGHIELAAPNICGGAAGAARHLPNRWLTAPLEGPLRQRFNTLHIENDGVAALMAERRWGALRGVDHCAYVTWSTGVGVGLCVDGRVLRGKHGNAGHAGHSWVSDATQALCGCGNVGDVESLVGGASIQQRLGMPTAVLFHAAADGQATAAATVAELCRVMGRLLYNLVVTLDLQRISLGGSVFLNHQGLLLPLLREQLAGHLPALTSGVELVPAGLGQQVGDYAALALLQTD